MSKITCEHSGIEFESKDGWINVKDRLPENMERVLIFYKILHRDQRVAFYINGGFYDDITSEENFCKWVTHWMPLPKPPKKVNNDE